MDKCTLCTRAVYGKVGPCPRMYNSKSALTTAAGKPRGELWRKRQKSPLPRETEDNGLPVRRALRAHMQNIGEVENSSRGSPAHTESTHLVVAGSPETLAPSWVPGPHGAVVSARHHEPLVHNAHAVDLALRVGERGDRGAKDREMRSRVRGRSQ